ncbi:MAG: acetylxylan esterase [Planctomycetes bacterium]|nr:acetylxylan esterase [Planctomycetota bacterium]
MVAEYFRRETQKLADACLAEIKTLDDWKKRRAEYRRQLFEMLGLEPRPPRTPLQPVVTGRVDRDTFFVEKLYFQSMPHLYVTANLYVPKNLKGRVPAILYVCGHGREKKGDISFGNKTHYQHHGAWFARNGYVCLMIDTLQLGEIEGIHHGTYRYKMWWWNARGYTPAGVEAWNCIRSLDYLQSRPEVDPERIGVTGRSGGGAYSWWIAALDDRIKVAVPVAGITTLKNHVVDGCVEGHCDCMYIVNTYRWDYPQVAALVAPRPLLISNSDKDRIFPLDGVVEVYFKIRRIYGLHGKLNQIGLQITEGPHKDTQELRIAAFHWFNRWLKGEDPLIEQAAVPMFSREELRVFDELPDDQINTRIQEVFVPRAAPPPVPQSGGQWRELKAGWMKALREKCFRGWPQQPEFSPIDQPYRRLRHGRLELCVYEFVSQKPACRCTSCEPPIPSRTASASWK